MDNRSLSHTRWKCQYHIVFIPKYRKRILYGRLREDVKEIISTLCKYRKVDMIVGAVCKDRVHLSVAIPPKESISDFMGSLKGKSTRMIYDRRPELQSKWDKAFWARGEQAEDSRREDSSSTAL
nr:IS200/IS605 family transposase [Lacrimispora amygdalina]